VVIARDVYFAVKCNADGTQLTDWLEIADLSRDPSSAVLLRTWEVMQLTVRQRNVDLFASTLADTFTLQVFQDGLPEYQWMDKQQVITAVTDQWKSATQSNVVTLRAAAGCGYLWAAWQEGMSSNGTSFRSFFVTGLSFMSAESDFMVGEFVEWIKG
jgi:hypothetical protein